MEGERLTADMSDKFEKIYKEYFAEVYIYVYVRIGNRQFAEDVTQDTFYIALKKGREFLEHPNPKWWLMRTARNRISELRRKAKYRVALSLEQDCPDLAREDSAFEEKELELAALKILDEKEWMMLKQYYLFGESVSELAESAGTTENNIRVRMTRLKKKLRGGINKN